MNTTDTIELILPFKAEYVSIARLTASGIASRLGFDFEIIEDIKVALAEVCNKLISIGSRTAQNYRIGFRMDENSLTIVFYCDDKSLRCIFGGEDEELGVSIISALMDEVEFCTSNDYVISMTKSKESEGN